MHRYFKPNNFQPVLQIALVVTQLLPQLARAVTAPTIYQAEAVLRASLGAPLAQQAPRALARLA